MRLCCHCKCIGLCNSASFGVLFEMKYIYRLVPQAIDDFARNLFQYFAQMMFCRLEIPHSTLGMRLAYSDNYRISRKRRVDIYCFSKCFVFAGGLGTTSVLQTAAFDRYTNVHSVLCFQFKPTILFILFQFFT